MPLKVSVGLSKKIGQPDYGSLGASCHVEYEADTSLLTSDLDAFHRQVKNAFVACKQAVQDELHRSQHGDNGESHTAAAASNGNGNGNGNGSHGNVRSCSKANGRRRDNTRRATASQVRALEAIADRQELDLSAFLQQRFGSAAANELSITEASSLIDELNSQNTNGGHR